MSRAIILMYHNIAHPPRGAKMRGLYVTPLMFQFQMWYLKVAGFTVVSLDEIYAFLNGDSAKTDKLVALTFDDGFADFYDNAYPVLKQYEYPATVYLVADRIGESNTWDAHKLNTKKKLMDWRMIDELHKNGITFGSHTLTHPFLTELTMDQAEAEITQSKVILEEKLGSPVKHFCYPSGNYNNDIVDLVRKAGYQTATITQRGHVHPGDNPFVLKRSFIKYRTYPHSFLIKLHTNYESR